MTPPTARTGLRMAERVRSGVDDPTTRVDKCACPDLDHLYYEIPILLHPNKDKDENDAELR